MAERINQRKYPKAKGPRPDRAATRQSEAAERQAKWDAMSMDERRASKAARGFEYAVEAGFPK